jgi:hypothetical protein
MLGFVLLYLLCFLRVSRVRCRFRWSSACWLFLCVLLVVQLLPFFFICRGSFPLFHRALVRLACRLPRWFPWLPRCSWVAAISLPLRRW